MDVLSPTTTKKLYSVKGIMIGSLLAGPIITGWLMAVNYNHLNLREKKIKVWLICIGAFIAMIAIGALLPQIPSVVFIFVNAAFGQYLPLNLQGKLIDDHVENGGALYSNWRAVGKALIITAIWAALILLAFYMEDGFVGESSY